MDLNLSVSTDMRLSISPSSVHVHARTWIVYYVCVCVRLLFFYVNTSNNSTQIPGLLLGTGRETDGGFGDGGIFSIKLNP